MKNRVGNLNNSNDYQRIETQKAMQGKLEKRPPPQ